MSRSGSHGTGPQEAEAVPATWEVRRWVRLCRDGRVPVLGWARTRWFPSTPVLRRR